MDRPSHPAPLPWPSRGRFALGMGVAALMMLAACGSPAARPAENAPSTPAERLDALNRLPAEERRATLLQEARKEGTVAWVGTLAQVEAEPFIASFNQAYPNIKVEYTRTDGPVAVDRLVTEYRTGRHLVDVVLLNHDQFASLKAGGVVGRYCSPEREAVAAQFKDQDCEWTVRGHNPQMIGFNTNKVSRDQAPRTWSDLLDPRWRGRLGIPADSGADWVATMEQMFGPERGQEFVRGMAAQQVQLHQSHTSLAQLIAAGDVDVGFMLNIPAVTNTQKQGGPIGSFPPDPLPTTLVSAVMTRNPPHPFAAALLIDYFLSKDGQLRMAEISTRFGTRTDMTYPEQHLLEGARLFVVAPEMLQGEGYERARRQFRELFGQR